MGSAFMKKIAAVFFISALCGGLLLATGCGEPANSGSSERYTLNVKASPVNGGEVSKTPSKASYASGERVTVKAKAHDTGNLDDMRPATLNMLNKYRSLIRPNE